MNLLKLFIGKEVLVKVDSYAVIGKLIRYEEGRKKQHIPQILILKSLSGNCVLLRFWNVILYPAMKQ